MTKELWVEKYRPKTVDEYVFRDDSQKRQVQSWITEKGIPHLLLSGQAGLGKTSLARMVLNEIGVHPSDVLEINGSSETGVEHMRDVVTRFISILPHGEYRYVIIDECDFLSTNAQASLRNVMETFTHVARFILTCNYPHKVIEGLKSRCQVFNFNRLDREQFAARVLEILTSEGVTVTEDDIDTIDSFITASYPDMRKCINNLQQSVSGGKLEALNEADVVDTEEYILNAIHLFKQKKYTEARKLICQHMKSEDYDKIFTFAYQNTNFWAGTQNEENQVIVHIRDAMAKAPLCADPEINIAAMFIELEGVAKG